MPKAHLEKIVDGLIRNAVENTPDEGEIVISITEKATGILLAVHDFGVGIPEAFQPRIFEGLFPVQEPTAYSTGKPYDFNAGGKGLDLLRIRIFSERYGFGIHMNSRCCPHAGRGAARDAFPGVGTAPLPSPARRAVKPGWSCFSRHRGLASTTGNDYILLQIFRR